VRSAEASSDNKLEWLVGVLVVITVLVSTAVKIDLARFTGTRLEIDQTLTAISLPDGGGQPFDVLAHAAQHKVVLVSMWASWCAPCRIEMPILDRLHTKRADDGFAVVSVNEDEDAAKAKAYLADHPVSFPVLYDPNRTLMERYGFSGLPAAIVIDKDGKVIQVLEGLTQGLEEYMVDAWLHHR